MNLNWVMPAEGEHEVADSVSNLTESATDEFLKVEAAGIEPIPAPQRHGRPRELAFLWAGAFVNYASLFTASLLTTYYGLGVWDGLAATVLGTLAAAVILGLLSNTGPRSGSPQIVFTRGIFGLRGSYLGAALTLFLALAPQFHWTQGPTAAGADYPGAIVLGFMTCFALVASWYPFASDYSRYLPAGSPVRAVTWWPIFGVVLPMALLGLFGLLLPTIDAKLAGSQGVLAVISAHAPVWVAAPFFIFVVVGEIWANYLDVYTAGLVTLAMGIRLQRWQTALGCGLLGTALAAYAVLVSDFHLAYEDFLILTYLWAPAWAAVVLLSFFVFEGRARPAAAVVAWLAGTLASLVFVNYDNLFSNLVSKPSFFNDRLIGGLHGADLSGLVSIAVAALVYLGLRRLRTA